MEQEQTGSEHAFDHLDVLLIARFGPAMRSAGAASASSGHCAAGLRPAGGPKKVVRLTCPDPHISLISLLRLAVIALTG
jgi:hypothetical protein